MEPIAIVGLGCLFPGARTPDELWQNLLTGRDSMSLATADQMGVDAELFFDATRERRDTYYAMRGGFVQDFQFDPHGYRIAPERLSRLDPLFQWSLYVARSALADSGYLQRYDRLARCGILLGSLSFPTRASHRLLAPIYYTTIEDALDELLVDTTLRLPRLPEHVEPALANGLLGGYPAAIVAAGLGLGGARFALDAACSSSLYAVKLACDYLNSHRADMMLAGAVSCAEPFFIHFGFSIFQAYPPAGESRPLDRTSGGLASGEGAGMLVLKRYADAVRDGDRIHAVIRGVGLSNDGAGKHLLVPNPKGQRLAYERAYREAGIEPASIGYVECHATGTPIGDIAELNSMEEFFGGSGHTPLIGSVKSNFGHLLTAAGMAGMIKTVLSMVHGTIPATIHVDHPLSSRNASFGAHTLVREPTAWPDTSAPRRAAVSGFGFGGTNAHLILEGEQAQPLSQSSEAHDRTQTALAIIGMDVCFGTCDGLQDFERCVAAGVLALRQAPALRWDGIRANAHMLDEWRLAGADAPPGGYIEEFDFDFLRAKTPPDSADQPIPQQLLMLKVADRALRDAGLRVGTNVAVLVAMGTELRLHRVRARADLSWQIPEALNAAGLKLSEQELASFQELLQAAIHDPAQINQYLSFIGNIMACRVAALWDFTGPAFTISAEENSVFRAIEVAQLMLAAREVEAVVVGAVDLAGGLEHVLLRSRLAAERSGSEGTSQDGTHRCWTPGDGAGAIVLRRQDDALAARQRIYALIEALAFASAVQTKRDQLPGRAGVEPVMEACKVAMRNAGVSPADVGYIELSLGGTPREDEAEYVGLARAYRLCSREPGCAIGSAAVTFGHSWAASGMLSLIKSALSLAGRYLPATPGWPGPQASDFWQDSSFYMPDRTRPWFAPSGARRRAAVNSLGLDGSAAHMIISQDPATRGQVSQLSQFSSMKLVPIAAHGPQELLVQLGQLAVEIESGAPWGELAGSCLETFRSRQDAPYALALLAGSPSELLREIAAARHAIPEAFERVQPWTTQLGSYFVPRPLGRYGSVAFVYPGAFNSYLGMGRQLFTLFPSLHERMAELASDVGRTAGDGYLYPRWSGMPSGQEIDMAKRRLRTTPDVMIESGTGLAIVLTSILRDSFGLSPHMAFGYSMGETTMHWALGVWRAGDEGGRRIHHSPLFTRRLAGLCEAGREYLGEPPGSQHHFWTAYVAHLPAEIARVRLQREQRVFLTHINTPHEVVIAGATADAERVIADLGCEAIPAPFAAVLHCDAMRSEHDALVALHHLPVREVADVAFYSSAHYAPAILGSMEVARIIARATCQMVDFPRLVRRVYDDGARVFVELGPGGTCTRWIGDILKQQEHVVMAANHRGTDDDVALLQVLAKLIAHRVEIDLAPLTQQAQVAAQAERAPKKALVRKVMLGGKDLRAMIVSDDHRRLLAPYRRLRRIEGLKTHEHLIAMGATEPVALQQGSDAVPTVELIDPPAPRTLGNTIGGHGAFLADRISTLRRMLDERLPDLDLHLPITSPNVPWLPISPDPITGGMSQKGLSITTNGTHVNTAPVVWDEDDLLEFARGDIGRVFGPEYTVIDGYARRVRLPMPPYLLVTRVTRREATRGHFKPSSITTEYDIPHDAWYSVDGQIAWAVAVESGQCDLLLISYLGIDFECRGERVYRLLDCTLTFVEDLPREGQTLRYDIQINSFARSGDTLLFFFSYRCFVGDKLVLKMDGGCAGFFSGAELDLGRGVVDSPAEIRARREAVPRRFAPLLQCTRRTFDRNDLLRLSEGLVPACFGSAYDQRGRNPSLRLAPAALLMIDRIVELDPEGGVWGLGLVVAEHDLNPEHWYFPCHFKDDQVLAGSLIAEGCCQLLQFYMLFLGLQTQTFDARFQPLPNVPQVVRCRGQVTPTVGRLSYRMEITDLGLTPRPYAKANVDIILDGRTVVRFTTLAVQLSEKNPSVAPPTVASHASDRPVLYSAAQISEFATGSLTACFGDDYGVYDGRRAPRTPNTKLQLISRVIAVEGRRGSVVPRSTLTSEYDVPLSPWFCLENSYPTTPYSILMEVGLQPCGFLSAHLGSTLSDLEQDFYFRNLDGNGYLLAETDIRGTTISNHIVLRSSTTLEGVIIQSFDFALHLDGEVFFRGDATFGYFTSQALAKQIGLDAGRLTRPWYQQSDEEASLAVSPLGPIAKRLDHASAGRPHERLAGPQLNFLDRVLVLPKGGVFGQGYVYAERAVDPRDWFFACHFFMDPVMPGSLGIEAMLQALQIFTLETGLACSFRSPRFGQVSHHQTTWKYRGQIVPSTGTMAIEIHVSRVEHVDDQVIVVADGNLWRDGLRIYHVQQLALAVKEAAPYEPTRFGC